jgi:hypothetical protein
MDYNENENEVLSNKDDVKIYEKYVSMKINNRNQ